jgi:two-component sensor histidine kinase
MTISPVKAGFDLVRLYRRGLILCLFISFLFPLLTFAQEPNFRHYNVMNGLPASSLFRIFEDENGKLILLSNKGLRSYDGAVFKIPVKEGNFVDNVFFHYQKDSIEDCMWFLSTNDQLFRYKNGILSAECSEQRFCWMDIDPITGDKWLMNRNGQIFGLKNGKASLFLSPNIIMPKDIKASCYRNGYKGINFVVTFATLQNREFILGTEFGFYHLSKGGCQLITSASFTYKSGMFPRVFRRLNGDLLMAGEKGLYKFDRKLRDAVCLFAFSHKEVIAFYEDKLSGDVWLGTSKGLYRFADGIIMGNRATRYLESYLIGCIFRDAEGVYWFGTVDNGMFSCNFDALHYKWQVGVSQKSIEFLKHDGNTMYAFSINGDAFYIENSEMVKIPKDGFGLSDNIRGILPNPKGGLIVLSGALPSIIKNKKPMTYRGEPCTVIDGRLYYFKKDAGIDYIEGNNRRPVLTGKQAHWIEEKYPFTIGAGQLYIEHSGAVYFFDKATKDLYKFIASNEGFRPQKFHIGKRVTSLAALYDESIIVLATEGKGIALLRNNKITWITQEDGLLSDFYTKLKADGPYIWACSDVGLSRIALTRRGTVAEISNFTADNVLLSNDVNDLEIMNDTIYVASSMGISLFPKNVNADPVNYHCYIGQLEVNNRDTAIISGYTFPYDENNVTVTLGQSSRQLQNVSYRYTLSNSNEIPTAIKSNVLNLASMQPGSYTLSVWSRNINGVWSAKPARLDFTIDPPFWKTLWFKLIIVGGLAFIALSILYTYQHRQRKKAEVSRMLVESDLRSLRLHMNPHFIFNSLTSLQSFIVTKKNEEAEEYISSFSNMIRSVMSYSVVGEITLSEEIEFLKQYIELELIRFDDQFHYTVSVSEDIQPETIIIPSLLIQPLVENAVKHGLTGLNHKATLKVLFTMYNGKLYCTVEDNGRGRTTATVAFNKVSGHISTGIRFTEERIRLLIKDDVVQPITITDLMDGNKPAGTRVTMVVPILE